MDTRASIIDSALTTWQTSKETVSLLKGLLVIEAGGAIPSESTQSLVKQCLRELEVTTEALHRILLGLSDDSAPEASSRPTK